MGTENRSDNNNYAMTYQFNMLNITWGSALLSALPKCLDVTNPIPSKYQKIAYTH